MEKRKKPLQILSFFAIVLISFLVTGYIWEYEAYISRGSAGLIEIVAIPIYLTIFIIVGLLLLGIRRLASRLGHKCALIIQIMLVVIAIVLLSFNSSLLAQVREKATQAKNTALQEEEAKRLEIIEHCEYASPGTASGNVGHSSVSGIVTAVDVQISTVSIDLIDKYGNKTGGSDTFEVCRYGYPVMAFDEKTSVGTRRGKAQTLDRAKVGDRVRVDYVSLGNAERKVAVQISISVIE